MKISYLLAFGFGCRLLLNLLGANVWLEERFELASPLTAWKRAKEAIFLSRNNLPLYEGDASHFPPLLVNFFSVLHSLFRSHMEFAFMLVDVVTAVFLYMAVSNFVKVQQRTQEAALSRHKDMDPKDYAELRLDPKEQAKKPMDVLIWTLFNPFLVLSCVAKSTAVFDHLYMASFLYFYSSANRIMASCCLAFASYVSFYPIGIVPALCLQMWKADKAMIAHRTGRKEFTTSDVVQSCFKTLLCFAFFCLGLAHVSAILNPSHSFIRSVYGFILSAPDSTPNLGLFWYLFAEMFDHFHHFFLIVFQLNPFIYILPLTFRLSDDPMFLVHQLIGIFAIFKSYPTLADIGFFIALMPLWSHLTKCMFLLLFH